MNGGSQFFWGMMFGAVGAGFFVYGKNQMKLVPLLAGIGLCIFPYFIESEMPFFLVGGALVLLPFWLGRE